MFYLMKFISLHLPLQLLLPLSLLNHGFLLSFTGIYVLLLFITLLLPIMLPHHFPLLPHQNLSLLLLQNQLLICKISFTLLLFLHQMFFQSPLLLFLFLIFTLCKLDLRVALPNLIKSGAIKPLLSIILQKLLPSVLLVSFPTGVRQWMKNFRHSGNNILGLSASTI